MVTGALQMSVVVSSVAMLTLHILSVGFQSEKRTRCSDYRLIQGGETTSDRGVRPSGVFELRATGNVLSGKTHRGVPGVTTKCNILVTYLRVWSQH